MGRKFVVNGNQTIAGQSYADGAVLDTSQVADPAEVARLRRESVLLDAEQYAIAFARSPRSVVHRTLDPNGRLAALRAQVESAEAHLRTMRERWLDIDTEAAGIIAHYTPLLHAD